MSAPTYIACLLACYQWSHQKLPLYHYTSSNPWCLLTDMTPQLPLPSTASLFPPYWASSSTCKHMLSFSQVKHNKTSVSWPHLPCLLLCSPFCQNSLKTCVYFLSLGLLPFFLNYRQHSSHLTTIVQYSLQTRVLLLILSAALDTVGHCLPATLIHLASGTPTCFIFLLLHSLLFLDSFVVSLLLPNLFTLGWPVI